MLSVYAADAISQVAFLIAERVQKADDVQLNQVGATVHPNMSACSGICARLCACWSTAARVRSVTRRATRVLLYS